LVIKLIYASGNYGKAILFGTLEFALLFVMTDLLGLPSAVAGLLILVSLFVDAVLDGIVGFIADRLRLKIGRYGPFILVGAPLAAAAFVTFASFPLIKQPEIGLIAATLFVFRLGYAVMDVPHNALIGTVAQTSRERADLAGIRFIFSSIASLTLAFTVGPLARDTTASEAILPERLFAFAIFASATSLITMIATFAAVHKADRLAAQTVPQRTSFVVAWRALINSYPYRVALASGTFTALLLPLHAKSQLYNAKYVLHEPTFAGSLLAVMTCAQILSSPVWLWTMKRIEKARAMQLAHLICAIGMVVGWVTLSKGELGLLFGSAIFGIGHFGVYSLIWSMIADCVDEARSRTGAHVEGMMFAVAIMSQKFALGIAIGTYGIVLSIIGFEPHQIADEQTITVFNTFGFVLPALGSVVSILLMRFYRLTHAAHARF
jgi:GPH family glycoside/pentoside/hexuronide:cation symporter